MKHLADIQKSAFGLRKNKNYNADLTAIRGERENNMRFSKYNNPSKRRPRKRLSKTDADIISTKNMLDDRRNGIDCPIEFYEEMSKKMQGKE